MRINITIDGGQEIDRAVDDSATVTIEREDDGSPHVPPEILLALKCCEISETKADCAHCPFDKNEDGNLASFQECRGAPDQRLKGGVRSMTAKQRITDDIIRCSVNDCDCCGFHGIGDTDYCKHALICAAALILNADDDDAAD